MNLRILHRAWAVVAAVAVLTAAVDAARAEDDESADGLRTLCIDDLENMACAEDGLLCAPWGEQTHMELVSRAVCQLLIYKKSRNPQVDPPDGVCTGFYFQVFDLPHRFDLLLTSRHCVDHIYYKYIENTDDPHEAVDFDEPAPPLGEVKVIARFGGDYVGGCVCSIPDPPEACRGPCSAPDVGAPDWPCNFFALNFQSDNWGYSGKDDWAVLALDPTKSQGFLPIDLPGQTQLVLGPITGNYGQTDYPLWVPQHPKGRCKEVSFGSDGMAVANDFQHRCDTEGGSSGSPVMVTFGIDTNGPDGHADGIADTIDGVQNVVGSIVIGIHRAGGCSLNDNTSWNRAVDIFKVFPQIPGAAADPEPDNERTRIVRAIHRALHPGDYNLDGSVGLLDFLILLQKFGAGNRANVAMAIPAARYSRYADHDGDGQITFIDLQRWLEYYRKANGIPLAPIPRPVPAGDMDGDADVDLADFAAIEACIQGPNRSTTVPCMFADTDVDGDVDLHDFAVMSDHWSRPD